MKSIYAAPAAITCGDVVFSTFTQKPFGNDLTQPLWSPSGGSGLSFGL